MILSFTLPRHPFEGLSRRNLSAVAGISSVVSIILGGLLLKMGEPLVNSSAPHGLASFELAATAEEINAILSSWGEMGAGIARLMTVVDYGFLCAYGASLASLSLVVPGASRFREAAAAFAWAGTAAAVLDVAENSVALIILSGRTGYCLPFVQAACAAPKFLLAALSLGWVAAGAFIKAPRD